MEVFNVEHFQFLNKTCFNPTLNLTSPYLMFTRHELNPLINLSLQYSRAMYREEEKLCLKWNDFQENAILAFGTLREDREFADVTLVCEDGQHVEAHKAIWPHPAHSF